MMNVNNFDKSLIGLSLEEAYKRILAAGLKTNLVKNKKTGLIESSKMARIMLFMPDYLTVSYDENRVVKSVHRG